MGLKAPLWRTTGAAVAMALCTGLGLADVLVTKDGLRFEGTVTQQSDKYVLKYAAGGEATFPRNLVREVIKSGDAAASAPAASAPTDQTAPSRPSQEYGRLYPIRADGKYGYMDRECKVVVEPQFSRAGGFHEGLAWVNAGADLFVRPGNMPDLSKTQPKFGYIDATGTMAIAAQFTFAGDFADGVAYVTVFSRERYESLPRWVPEAKFSNLPRGQTVPSEILIDRAGTPILNFGDSLSRTAVLAGRWLAPEFGEGLAPFRRGMSGRDYLVVQQAPPEFASYGNCGYRDKQGNEAIPPTFREARSFHEGLAAVQMPDTYNGRQVISQRLWGYVDKWGKWVIEPQFDDACEFSEGLAFVKLAKIERGVHRPDFWQIIDRSGKAVLKTNYLGNKPPGAFHDGWAILPGEDSDDKRPRYIDKSGKRLTILDEHGGQHGVGQTLDIGEAGDFAGGLARVTFMVPDPVGTSKKFAQQAYIDTKGRIVWLEAVPAGLPQTPVVPASMPRARATAEP